MNRRFGLKSHEGGEIGLTHDDSFMRLESTENWPHLKLNANSAERESKWPKAVAAAAATAVDREKNVNTQPIF